MVMAGKQDVIARSRGGEAPPRPRPPAVLTAVIAAGGAGFAVLAGLDGSPTWQAAAVWFTRRAGRGGQGATALLLGIAGTAAGLGVAGAHLRKPARTRPPWRR